MKELQVQIIKGERSCWYHDLVGRVFTVYENRRDYILKEDYDRSHRAVWRHILKEDAKTFQQLEEERYRHYLESDPRLDGETK